MVFKNTTMGPLVPQEMKYNLHYGDVRGDVLPPPHNTNTSLREVKIKVKNDCLWKQRTHTTDKKM